MFWYHECLGKNYGLTVPIKNCEDCKYFSIESGSGSIGLMKNYKYMCKGGSNCAAQYLAEHNTDQYNGQSCECYVQVKKPKVKVDSPSKKSSLFFDEEEDEEKEEDDTRSLKEKSDEVGVDFEAGFNETKEEFIKVASEIKDRLKKSGFFLDKEEDEEEEEDTRSLKEKFDEAGVDFKAGLNETKEEFKKAASEIKDTFSSIFSFGKKK